MKLLIVAISCMLLYLVNNNNNGILYSAGIRLKEDAHGAVAENNYTGCPKNNDTLFQKNIKNTSS